jgi:hypothetical protein
MQIIHLTRAIPLTAFSIGIDQLATDILLEAWELPDSPGVLLACSAVFTLTMLAARALVGIPFVKSVFKDLVERPEK